MAGGTLSTDDRAYSHVMECSPCYEELMTLTEHIEARRVAMRPGRRLLPALAASIAVIAVLTALWIFTRKSATLPSPTAPTQPQVAENRPPAPTELPVGVLNLESDSGTRGEGQIEDRGLQRLPRRRMNLMIYLPLGLDEGVYEIEVARPEGQALIKMSGTARIENGLTTLKAQADFSGLDPGRYELRYRLPGRAWRRSVFSLR